MELKLVPQQTLSQKQNQLLMMLPKMQQAILFLQAPVMDLSALIQEEMQRNVLLEEEEAEDDSDIDALVEDEREEELELENKESDEVHFDDHDFEVMKKLDEDYRDHFNQSGDVYTANGTEDEKRRLFLENSIQSHESLYDFLMVQVNENFDEVEDKELAAQIVGNIDANGFLGVSLEEMALSLNAPIEKLQNILTRIQSFEPCGVGALDVREGLMLQLKRKNKEHTLSFRILEQYFDDLLHNRIPVIAKALHCTHEAVEQAISSDIAKLELKPGALFALPYTAFITPDATIDEIEGQLTVMINQEALPSLRVNRHYLRLMEKDGTNEETKRFIRMHLQSAKWLMHNVFQRGQTLRRVLECLMVKQGEYLRSQRGELVPLVMKAVAQELELHESTIARAVAGKYVWTPRGMMPMRRFFSNSLPMDSGEETSTEVVRDRIKKMIDEEDKCRPFSDEKIMELLKGQGLICARRTVAKYRRMLEYGNAHQRKKYI